MSSEDASTNASANVDANANANAKSNSPAGGDDGGDSPNLPEPAFDPLDLDTPIKYSFPQDPLGKLEECMRLKEIANARFKAAMYGPAIQVYARAMAYVKGLDGGNPLNQQMAQMLGPSSQKKLADSGGAMTEVSKT